MLLARARTFACTAGDNTNAARAEDHPCVSTDKYGTSVGLVEGTSAAFTVVRNTIVGSVVATFRVFTTRIGATAVNV